jgi:hypothetical protein
MLLTKTATLLQRREKVSAERIPRLVLVGVVVIVIGCKLCARAPTEQQVSSGPKDLGPPNNGRFPSDNEKKGQRTPGPLFIVSCNTTFSKSRARARSLSPTFECGYLPRLRLDI